MKRHNHEEHENHERWLVSYADFITLLFAFFVVMYAISSVNEGKYKVLSSTLENVFSNPPSSKKPIAVITDGGSPVKLVNQEAASGDSDKVLKAIRDQLSQDLSEYIAKDQVGIHDFGDWLEIDIKSQLLFGSGSAVIDANALPALGLVSGVLRSYSTPVHIEGHTDNVPIVNSVYASNWELSAARAVSVLRLLAEQGVDSSRMAAIGYGEFQPAADNNTEDGRSRNRRVVIVVSKSSDLRQAILQSNRLK